MRANTGSGSGAGCSPSSSTRDGRGSGAVISPDGRWIAFTTWDDAAGGPIWKVRSNGGTPERLVVASRTDAGFIFYRPRLSMRVVSFEVERDEWGAAVAWSMALEEA